MASASSVASGRGGKQTTLMQAWGATAANNANESNVDGPSNKDQPPRLQSSAEPTSTRVRMAGKGNPAKRGGGTRRGRGGTGKSSSAKVGKNRKQVTYVPNSVPDETQLFDDDDDDVLCAMALDTFEVQSNVDQAFASVNEEKQLPGFDLAAGDIWIYPTNKPVRDYQFNIVQIALYNNTLVSLPTGLGKTFIAAVVMFNFHRWYPENLIVFMAPTRPLVTQQIEACNNIMGIVPSKMMELTGQVAPAKRQQVWQEKKVLFLTPQVMERDLESGCCPAEKVRLVVVDEAHRAQGNYSYVQVISKLAEKHKYFRVLALSATPGNDTISVQEVLKNLLISRVELRSDTSPDILPYTREKDVETVVVRLDDNGKIVHDKIMEVFQSYTGKLMQDNALTGRVISNISQFQLLKARDAFRASSTASKVPAFVKGQIEVNFATAITLAHSLELITAHGLRSFYSFLSGVINKEKGHPQVTADLRRKTNVEEILNELKEKLNITANNSSLNTSGFLSINNENASLQLPDNSTDYFISHPKFKVLKELVVKHFEDFKTSNRSTRVMIFSQYRDSVQEIGNMLNTLRPLIKPMVFVGQSSSMAKGRGLKQREQEEVVRRFREGGYNILVSTSVGEEGLDIGEVDLIICFDCNKSPTRMIQRMGRTGRKREGRTIFLLTHGKEEAMYRQSIYQSRAINKNILDVQRIQEFLYKQSPRMVPSGVNPQCFKMDIILSSEQEQASFKTKGGKELKTRPKQKYLISSESTNEASNEHGVELTLTQCFARQNEPVIDKVAKPIVPGIAPNEDDCLSSFYDENDCAILNNENHLGVRPAWNDNEYETLCKLLNIQSITERSVVECLRIPKSTAKFEWLSSYNNINPERIILKDSELNYVKEKVEVAFTLGNSATHCGCGLLYNAVDDFVEADMENMDLDLDSFGFDIAQIEDKEEHYGNANSNNNGMSVRPVNVVQPELNELRNVDNVREGGSHRQALASSFSHPSASEDQTNEAFDDDEFPDFDFDASFLFEGETKASYGKHVELTLDPEAPKKIFDQSVPSLSPYPLALERATPNRKEEHSTDVSQDDIVCLDDDSSTTSNEEFIPVRSRQPYNSHPASANHGEMDSSTTSNEEFIPVRARQFVSVADSAKSPRARNVEERPESQMSQKNESLFQAKLPTPSMSSLKPPNDTHLDLDLLMSQDSNSNSLLGATPSDTFLPVQHDKRQTKNINASPILVQLDSSPEKSPVLKRLQDSQTSEQVQLSNKAWTGSSSPEKSPVLRPHRQSQPSIRIPFLQENTENDTNESFRRLLQDKDEEYDEITVLPPDTCKDSQASSSSDEFLPPSPERKSNPIRLPQQNEPRSAAIKKAQNQSKSLGISIPSRPKITNITASYPLTNLPVEKNQNQRTTEIKKASSGWTTWNNPVVAKLPQANRNNSLALARSSEPQKKTFEFNKSSARKIEFDGAEIVSKSPETDNQLSLKKPKATEANLKPLLDLDSSGSDLEGFMDSASLKLLPPTCNIQLHCGVIKNCQTQTQPVVSRWIKMDKQRPGTSTKVSPPDPQSSKLLNLPTKQKTRNENVERTSEMRLKRRRKRRKRNQFIDDEASATDKSSSGNNETDSDESGLDDSFVDKESEITFTESQQVRYINALKSPGMRGLLPNPGIPHELSGTQYEPDSFCVPNDEIEYAEVGTFTQAMLNAQAEVEKEAEEETNRRLRAQLGLEESADRPPPGRRLRRHGKLQKGSPPPLASSASQQRKIKTKRKRILEPSSSDESDL